MKKILVTGGAGYIGSHTCKLLAQRGYLPITYDNLVYGHSWAVQWGPFIQGDIADTALLDKVFAEHQPEAVIHFAAFAYVGESVQQPEKYYQNNVAGTLALLEVMRRYDCQQLIFSSTCATYGNPQTLPLTEAHPQQPINPYGRSKLMIEQILEDYSSAYELASISLRYFNAAGADLEGQVGEEHDPETHLVPLVIQAALGRRSAIEIFGTDYDTPDGTAIRDYIHVADLADAHVRALEFLEKEKKSLAVNLGTGTGTSVQRIIQAVEELSERKVPVKLGPRRPGDPPTLIASADKAEKLLGWRPQCSAIETIIRSALAWHTARENR
ncbi:MAG: UDP-glucose 4-epimerase GalE [Candidatus Electrothrix aestuarii]|uniref:UDP-glucose 4-epimerase n=1 Tax=Candidatus Electrothrix aestuarii TaxID=3062594 RepID=A0AAU8LX16_9BACT|nr:UDP-glucose 4-epimerase GalE [Candidatus Electrothrix aestuarii]